MALEAAGVPNAPVQDTEQIASHPQTLAVDIKRGGGNLEFFGLPVRLDGKRPDLDSPCSPLGGDNDWLDALLTAEAAQ